MHDVSTDARKEKNPNVPWVKGLEEEIHVHGYGRYVPFLASQGKNFILHPNQVLHRVRVRIIEGNAILVISTISRNPFRSVPNFAKHQAILLPKYLIQHLSHLTSTSESFHLVFINLPSSPRYMPPS